MQNITSKGIQISKWISNNIGNCNNLFVEHFRTEMFARFLLHFSHFSWLGTFPYRNVPKKSRAWGLWRWMGTFPYRNVRLITNYPHCPTITPNGLAWWGGFDTSTPPDHPTWISWEASPLKLPFGNPPPHNIYIYIYTCVVFCFIYIYMRCIVFVYIYRYLFVYILVLNLFIADVINI